MASTVEILLRAKNDTDAAFKAVIKNLESAGAEAKKTNAILDDMANDLKAGLAGMAGPLGKVGEALGSLGPAGLVAAASIGALVTAVAAAVKITYDATLAAAAYGDNLAALADKTGLSTDALQSLEVAAQLGNSSLEAVTGAVNKMQKALVDGSGNFAKLGLSIQQLREMSPDEQFTAVAVAIEKINDPAEKAAARIAIFGKAGNELAGTLKAAAQGAGELGGALSGEALAASAALQDNADLLAKAWERVQLQFGAAVASSPELQRAIEDITDAIVSMATSIGQAAPEIAKFFDGAVMAARGAIALIKGFASGDSLAELKAAGQQIAMDAEDAAERARIIAERLAFEKKHFVDEEVRFHGEGEDKKLKAEAEAAAKRAELAEKEFFRQRKLMADKIKSDYDLQNEGFQRELKLEHEALQAEIAANEASLDHKIKMEDLKGAAIAKRRKEEREANAEMIADLRDLARATLDFADLLGGAFGKFLNIAGNVTGAIASIKGSIADIKGGGILDKLIGGVGIASTVLSVGKGLFDSLFGGAKKAREEMEKLRSEFIKGQGGMSALEAKAKQAGITLDAMFRAKSAGQLSAAIDKIKAQLETWGQAQQDLADAMERYGLTVDQMGPRFAQQQLDQQAAQLIKDFALLTQAGADVVTVTGAMADELNAYVNSALKSGATIPESMRKIIDALFASGQLLHENGEAYTQAEKDGLNYTQTMSEQFAGLMQQIQKLVEALARGFQVPVNFHYTSSGESSNPNGSSHQPPKDLPEFAMGGNTGPGGVVMTHPNEWVIPDDKLAGLVARAVAMAGAASGGSSMPPVITVEIDGRKLDSRISNRMRQRGIRSPQQQRGRRTF